MNEPIEAMPRYEAYRDSGIEWLGNIPADWKVTSIRYAFSFMNNRRRPLSAVERETRQGPYPYYGASGIIDYVDEYLFDEPLILIAEDGANLLSKSTQLAFIAEGKYWVNNHAHILKAKYSGFNYWAELLSAINYTEYISGAAQPKLTRDRLAGILVPVPPEKEIINIANFLKSTSAKINQAITIKEKQITLLREHKQILIQKAVTRGLDPDAPMRDSGVEWIGEIPAHWEVKRLKYILNERKERSKNGEEPLLMVSQLHGLVVRSDFHEKAEVAQSNIGSKVVHKNDLVFNKLKAHLGVFFKSNIGFKGLVSPDYAVYQSKGVIVDLKYLECLFRNPKYIGQFIIRATGIVEGLIRLYTDDLFEISIPVPPEKEQISIISHIATRSAAIDKAIALYEQQIGKLKEYKATLINSAVTGKIKVPMPEEIEAQA